MDDMHRNLFLFAEVDVALRRFIRRTFETCLRRNRQWPPVIGISNTYTIVLKMSQSLTGKTKSVELLMWAVLLRTPWDLEGVSNATTKEEC